MASSNKSVLRNDNVKDVESLELPSWDKEGNEIRKVVKTQAKPTQVEDVAEEKVKVPTLKEVEGIREDAYNEGFEQGFQNGLGQGQREGEIQGKKQGYEAGFQEGLAAGVVTGQEQAIAEERVKTESKLAVLGSFANELKNLMSQEQEELQQAMLALTIRIARQVLQDELHIEPKHIGVIVHAAVQSLPNPDEKLTVLLNPSEIDYVATFADSHWTLESDESVTVGGCKIKSKFSYIDYTLEHRFDNAVVQLVSQLENVDALAIIKPITEVYLLPIEEHQVAEPVIEESVIEESVVEESVIEESVIEESVVEESAIEESVVDEKTTVEKNTREESFDKSADAAVVEEPEPDKKSTRIDDHDEVPSDLEKPVSTETETEQTDVSDESDDLEDISTLESESNESTMIEAATKVEIQTEIETKAESKAHVEKNDEPKATSESNEDAHDGPEMDLKSELPEPKIKVEETQTANKAAGTAPSQGSNIKTSIEPNIDSEESDPKSGVDSLLTVESQEETKDASDTAD